MALKKTVSLQKITLKTCSPNYQFKPLCIGKLVESLMVSKGISMEQLAKHLGITKRACYTVLKNEYVRVPCMMKLSELLQHDLFREYRPNIPPSPDETVELKKQLAISRDMGQVLGKRVDLLSQEIKKLNAEKDLLANLVKELMQERMK